MKKLLLGVLILLVVGLIVTFINSGINIGDFRIFSFKDIRQAHLNLDTKFKESDELKNITYIAKIDELNSQKSDLQKARDRYNVVASANTIDVVTKAGIVSEYNTEYLWVRLR